MSNKIKNFSILYKTTGNSLVDDEVASVIDKKTVNLAQIINIGNNNCSLSRLNKLMRLLDQVLEKKQFKKSEIKAELQIGEAYRDVLLNRKWLLENEAVNHYIHKFN